MSKLNTLKNRDPREVAKILSLVSRTVLPNPGVEEVINQTEGDPEFVRQVLDEVRKAARVPAGDLTPESQAKVFAIISSEISSATIPNDRLDKIKDRLGDEGALRPSQYKVVYQPGDYNKLGVRKSEAEEAITNPDQVSNLETKFLPKERKLHLTISSKFVRGKRPEDSFNLIVVSVRSGQAQLFHDAVRVYPTDVDLRGTREPIDVLRAFVKVYGVPFKLGKETSSFMVNEIVRYPEGKEFLGVPGIKPVATGLLVSYRVVGGDSTFRNQEGALLAEVLIAYMIDTSKYLDALLSHHVYIDPDTIAEIRQGTYQGN